MRHPKMQLPNEILLEGLAFQSRSTLSRLQWVNHSFSQLIQREFPFHPYQVFPLLVVGPSEEVEEDDQCQDRPMHLISHFYRQLARQKHPSHPDKAFQKHNVQGQNGHQYRVTCYVPHRRRLTFHQLFQMLSDRRGVRFAQTRFLSTSPDTLDYFCAFVEMFRELRFLWQEQIVHIGR
jgi:hypothetical protein